MIAWPKRPSRRASPLTCEPRPGIGSKAHTSKTPPSVSWSWPAALIAAFMRSEASGSRQRTGLSSTPSKSVERQVVAQRDRLGADAHHVAADLGAVAAQQRLGHAAGRDAGGGLAGARALEDRPQVVGAVLEHARQVGVPGARERDRLDLVVRLPDRHAVGRPVREVEVGDLERQRAADGAPVPQAGLHLDAVASRSSSGRRGRSRAGGARGRRRCRRGRAGGRRAGPRPPRRARGRGTPRLCGRSGARRRSVAAAWTSGSRERDSGRRGATRGHAAPHYDRARAVQTRRRIFGLPEWAGRLVLVGHGHRRGGPAACGAVGG